MSNSTVIVSDGQHFSGRTINFAEFAGKLAWYGCPLLSECYMKINVDVSTFSAKMKKQSCEDC